MSSVFFSFLTVISPAFITVVNARGRLSVCLCLHLLCFKYVTTSWNLTKLTTRNYVLDTSYLLATLIIKLRRNESGACAPFELIAFSLILFTESHGLAHM
jgi:hypothetical protein